jgi:hypothetical protein
MKNYMTEVTLKFKLSVAIDDSVQWIDKINSFEKFLISTYDKIPFVFRGFSKVEPNYLTLFISHFYEEEALKKFSKFNQDFIALSLEHLNLQVNLEESFSRKTEEILIKPEIANIVIQCFEYTKDLDPTFNRLTYKTVKDGKLFREFANGILINLPLLFISMKVENLFIAVRDNDYESFKDIYLTLNMYNHCYNKEVMTNGSVKNISDSLENFLKSVNREEFIKENNLNLKEKFDIYKNAL